MPIASEPPRTRRICLLATALVALTACIVGDLASEGRPCSTTKPCGPGAICDQSKGLCVKIAGDGPRDQPAPTELQPDRAQGDGRPDRSIVDQLQRDAHVPPDKKGKEGITADVGACTPPCSGSKAICCPLSKSCVASLTDCACDVSSGEPCEGSFPVCCDKGSGLGPRCQGSPDACLCSKTTSNPCFGAYPTCCDKSPDGGAPTFKCYASTTGCKP